MKLIEIYGCRYFYGKTISCDKNKFYQILEEIKCITPAKIGYDSRRYFIRGTGFGLIVSNSSDHLKVLWFFKKNNDYKISSFKEVFYSPLVSQKNKDELLFYLDILKET